MNYKEKGERLGLDENEYIELLQLFVKSGHADLQKLKNGLDQRDIDLVVHSAHTLKGASGNLGLMTIYEMANQIENKAADLQIESLDQQVQLLADHFNVFASSVPRTDTA